MKPVIALILMFASVTCVPAAAKKPEPVKKAAAAPTAKPITIPPDAVVNADGSYSYTDKKGKKWIFNKTPFGISRMEDMGTSGNAPAGSKDQFISAVDAGDSVRFVRKTPFGETKWEKKKTDLTDEERRVVEKLPATSQSNQQ